MKFRIGYRTIKTALGTTLAIILANAFGLDNFASAGILTILCIKATKVKSLQASWERILACIVGMTYAAILFEFIAYHPLVICLLLLIFIPTTVLLKSQEGIVSSSVIIFHIYNAGEVTVSLILNEIGLIIIGIGMALLMNLYMPSLENKLYEYQNKIESNFRKMMLEIVHFLRTNDHSWNGAELAETEKLIEEAKKLAYKEVENHVFTGQSTYFDYFKMRERQFEIIERILPLAASLPFTMKQGKMIANFIEEIAEFITPGEVQHDFMKKLNEMRTEFQNMELPKTRAEFEVRAALLQLIREIQEYLTLKKAFKNLVKKKNNNLKKLTVLLTNGERSFF